jgi:hypothetical protein
MRKGYSDPVTLLETSRITWVLFGLPFPAVAALAAVSTVVLDPGFWFPAVALGVFSTFHLAWLRTARLTLTDKDVSYRALFVSRRLQLAEIERARFEFGPKGTGPMQRVIFELRDTSKKEVTVNAGLFDMHQTKQWIQTLNARLHTSVAP